MEDKNEKLKKTNKLNKEEINYMEKLDFSIVITVIFFSILMGIVFQIVSGTGLVICIIIGIIFIPFVLRQKTILKCPNCNEEIIVQEEQISKINDNESTYVCPKCNCKLFLNTQNKTVTKSDTIENKEHNIVDNKDYIHKIEELYNLKNKGIITEDEFEHKKQELLNKF